MSIYFHEEDLPADVRFREGPIAVDTEAMGLYPARDRLCLVQLSDGRGDEHLVRFARSSDYAAPNLKALLADPRSAEALPLRPLRHRHHAALSRDHGRAALLHAHGVAAGADLHRPAWPQGTGQGDAGLRTCRSSSRPATGARRRSMTRSANMRRATSAIFTR